MKIERSKTPAELAELEKKIEEGLAFAENLFTGGFALSKNLEEVLLSGKSEAIQSALNLFGENKKKLEKAQKENKSNLYELVEEVSKKGALKNEIAALQKKFELLSENIQKDNIEHGLTFTTSLLNGGLKKLGAALDSGELETSQSARKSFEELQKKLEETQKENELTLFDLEMEPKKKERLEKEIPSLEKELPTILLNKQSLEAELQGTQESFIELREGIKRQIQTTENKYTEQAQLLKNKKIALEQYEKNPNKISDLQHKAKLLSENIQISSTTLLLEKELPDLSKNLDKAALSSDQDKFALARKPFIDLQSSLKETKEKNDAALIGLETQLTNNLKKKTLLKTEILSLQTGLDRTLSERNIIKASFESQGKHVTNSAKDIQFLQETLAFLNSPGGLETLKHYQTQLADKEQIERIASLLELSPEDKQSLETDVNNTSSGLASSTYNYLFGSTPKFTSQSLAERIETRLTTLGRDLKEAQTKLSGTGHTLLQEIEKTSKEQQKALTDKNLELEQCGKDLEKISELKGKATTLSSKIEECNKIINENLNKPLVEALTEKEKHDLNTTPEEPKPSPLVDLKDNEAKAPGDIEKKNPPKKGGPEKKPVILQEAPTEKKSKEEDIAPAITVGIPEIKPEPKIIKEEANLPLKEVTPPTEEPKSIEKIDLTSFDKKPPYQPPSPTIIDLEGEEEEEKEEEKTIVHAKTSPFPPQKDSMTKLFITKPESKPEEKRALNEQCNITITGVKYEIIDDAFANKFHHDAHDRSDTSVGYKDKHGGELTLHKVEHTKEEEKSQITYPKNENSEIMAAEAMRAVVRGTPTAEISSEDVSVIARFAALKVPEKNLFVEVNGKKVPYADYKKSLGKQESKEITLEVHNPKV